MNLPPPARIIRNTIGDALARAVRRAPTRTALIYGERSWSYAELDAAINKVAHALLAAGFAKGERIAAYAKNSDTYAILWLACCRAGLVHVPANYSMTTPELAYVLRQSGSAALFSDGSPLADLDAACAESKVRLRGSLDSGGASFDVLAVAQGAGEGSEPAVAIDDHDLAQLLYTSGTTSAPKAAMMTHRALLAEYGGAIHACEIRADELFLCALPLYHSAAMHVFLVPQLLVGGTSIIIAGPQPDLVFKLIQQHRVAAFFAPPTAWISLLRHPGFDRHDLSSLSKAYYGAAIMPEPVLAELRQRLPGIRPYNCYGQSEIGPLATVLGPEDHDARATSAGLPLPSVELRIVDPEMRDVAPGQLGEIVYRSPQLLLGYWDKPDQTEEAFEGGWFHSGDVGRFDEDGFVYVVDRIKDIVKSGGVVVSSREVEDCLYTHPAVAEVAVIALPDPKWIEAVTAVVKLKSGVVVVAEELIAHAKLSLAPFKIPKNVHFVDDLPRNASGKILKRELRDRLAPPR